MSHSGVWAEGKVGYRQGRSPYNGAEPAQGEGQLCKHPMHLMQLYLLDPPRIAGFRCSSLKSQDPDKGYPFFGCPPGFSLSHACSLVSSRFQAKILSPGCSLDLSSETCPPNPSSTTRPLCRDAHLSHRNLCAVLAALSDTLGSFLLLLGATHSVPILPWPSLQSMIKALQSFRGLLSSVIYLEKCPTVWVFWNYNVFLF